MEQGGLKRGDQILSVNNISLEGLTHQEAVNILRNAGDEIKLLVCDGFNPNSLPQVEGNACIFHFSTECKVQLQ